MLHASLPSTLRSWPIPNLSPPFLVITQRQHCLFDKHLCQRPTLKCQLPVQPPALQIITHRIAQTPASFHIKYCLGLNYFIRICIYYKITQQIRDDTLTGTTHEGQRAIVSPRVSCQLHLSQRGIHDVTRVVIITHNFAAAYFDSHKYSNHVSRPAVCLSDTIYTWRLRRASSLHTIKELNFSETDI